MSADDGIDSDPPGKPLPSWCPEWLAGIAFCIALFLFVAGIWIVVALTT